MPKLYCTVKIQRVDGLCTTCWLPGLMRTSVITLQSNGVNERIRDYCHDCGSA